MAGQPHLAQLLSANPKYRCLDCGPKACSPLAVILAPVIKFKMFCVWVWFVRVWFFFPPPKGFLTSCNRNILYFRTILYILMDASFGAGKCLDASKKSLDFFLFFFFL